MQAHKKHMILLSNHLLKPHNTRKKIFQNAFSIIGPGQQKHKRRANRFHTCKPGQPIKPTKLCQPLIHVSYVTQLTQANKQILTNNSITATPQVWQQTSKPANKF